MKPSSSRLVAVVTLVLAGVMAFLAARSAAVEAVYPVEKVRRSFADKVMSRLHGLWAGAEAKAENVRLKRELAALGMVRQENERLEAENERLRKALSYSSSKRGKWLAASILSVDGGASGLRDVIRVNKGSLDGVREGAVVVVPEGLVGRVESVSLHTSEIALIISGAVKVACEIEDGNRVIQRGIICGGAEDRLNLKFTIGSSQVPPRSRVITSGLGGVFPRGVEIGTFIADGEVLPSVDFSELEDVFIGCEK